MKHIVDKMPVDQKHCPYHELTHGVGEIIDKSFHMCKFDRKECNFEKSPPNIHYTSCRWLKEL